MLHFLSHTLINKIITFHVFFPLLGLCANGCGSDMRLHTDCQLILSSLSLSIVTCVIAVEWLRVWRIGRIIWVHDLWRIGAHSDNNKQDAGREWWIIKHHHLHPNLWTSKVSKRCPMKEHCTVNSVVTLFTRNLQSSVDWVVHRVWRYLVLWLFIGLDTTFDLYCRRYAGVVGFDHPPMRKWWSRGQALHCWEQSSWCAEHWCSAV